MRLKTGRFNLINARNIEKNESNTGVYWPLILEENVRKISLYAFTLNIEKTIQSVTALVGPLALLKLRLLRGNVKWERGSLNDSTPAHLFMGYIRIRTLANNIDVSASRRFQNMYITLAVSKCLQALRQVIS